jgi:hypothetical protein
MLHLHITLRDLLLKCSRDVAEYRSRDASGESGTTRKRALDTNIDNFAEPATTNNSVDRPPVSVLPLPTKTKTFKLGSCTETNQQTP